jgi:hypothetical protein
MFTFAKTHTATQAAHLCGSVINRNRTAFHGSRYIESPLERWINALNSHPRIHEPSFHSCNIALIGCENSGVLSTIMQYAWKPAAVPGQLCQRHAELAK